MTGQEKFIDIGLGLNLHLREWPGDGQPFVLLHGLASNSLTWQQVAAHLNQAGHRVMAVNQRGHGLSDKPDDGYDFATIAADLANLIDTLKLERPLLVGQSWGGNVLLEFGARYPEVACGLAWIDGGFLDLQSRPNATWDTISQQLKPPRLNGMPRAALKQRIQAGHPDWEEWGVEATLGNFETLPDGTIRPWLTLEHHMSILRAMWEQRPAALYGLVAAPTLICVAEDPTNLEWNKVKARQLMAAQTGLTTSEAIWFTSTDHDIHVHRPAELARVLLTSLQTGVWHRCAD
jgi:pimeloyl-ACP methyl ester carboxylesterase